AGMPLPPAVSKRGGHSSRESHDHNLVPPFKGKTVFQPVFAHARAEIAEAPLKETPVVQPVPEVKEPEVATVEAVLQEAESNSAELPAEVEAVIAQETFDVQDLFGSESDFAEVVEAPLEELTLSPEFEKAPVLSGHADASSNGHDSVVRDAAILEIGAFIAP